jgi:sialate O-acetylesterase
MVFQSGKPLRFFGTCKKGVQITIEFLDQEVTFKTKSTEFLVELDPVQVVDKGFSFSIYTKKQIETIYNCLFGDVYFFVGGKNVYMPLKETYHEDDYDNCDVRFIDLKKGLDSDYNFTNEVDWNLCGKRSMDDYSALGYLFAKYLHTHIDIPLGIISCNHHDSTVFSFLGKVDTDTHLGISSFLSSLDESIINDLHVNRLFDSLIEPIIPFSMKTIVFYQGESDYSHYDLFEAAIIRVIKSYRIHFKDTDLPFIITQLAGYNYPYALDEQIGVIRDVQSSLMDESKKIYVVSAIDLGDENHVCPKDKLVLAKRLTNIALEKFYKVGKNSISPSFYSYRMQQDGIVIYTQNNYLNLVSHSNQFLGFTYSKNGKDFYDVKNVEIMNNRIIIKDTENVKEIRYAYKKYPFCDIYTTNELPLLPFRIKLID